ncbi:hypothetical protein DXG03_006866 [Asterophora parasitica]|uniref:General substrate transporter n=1 Tax=Asterophora parasitica TaxID=117018 RepID=A0A9P7K969_9AGAR|nr:hypothetical protein DXG03_006866 [Asterophora parasitica]
MSKIYAFARPGEVDLKVKVLHAAVQRSIDITNSTTFMQRLKSMLFYPINRRALIVGCGMQAFQQLCGFNTLMYYSATLFKEIGFDQPVAVGLIISGTNFIFTLVALKWIDKIGRRKIMVWSAPGMVLGLTLASISFHLRGLGTSLSTATNWAGNLLIGATYLSLMAKITPAGAFGFYAGLCLLGWFFVLACFPETAGLSLEEVNMVFRNGFGIRESQRLRKTKKEIQKRDQGKRTS